MGCIVHASLGSNPLSLTGDLESYYQWLILMGLRFGHWVWGSPGTALGGTRQSIYSLWIHSLGSCLPLCHCSPLGSRKWAFNGLMDLGLAGQGILCTLPQPLCLWAPLWVCTWAFIALANDLSLKNKRVPSLSRDCKSSFLTNAILNVSSACS